MINFLILSDTSGVIQETKWSNPAYIVSMQTRTVFDIFASDSHEQLRQLLKESLHSGSLMHCSDLISLAAQDKKVSLCILPVDKKLLLFAVDSDLADSCSAIDTFTQIIHSFLSIIKGYNQEIVFQKSEASRFHFEKIQGLNNELINTQRKLEKANAKLAQLNQDLNNRLVKDALTGLVSRYQYRTEIEQLIATDPQKKGIFTFIDIDKFKAINDNYGHAIGDAYLIEFADRLKSIPLTKTIKMRISGDEFGLYSHGYSAVEDSDIALLWQQVELAVLSSPVIVNNHTLPLSVSAGMAIYGQDTCEIYDLIDYADFAMYRAKQAGRKGYRRFSLQEYRHAGKE